MIILSIATIFAYPYFEFISENSRRGRIISIIKGNWKTFKEDSDLIKKKSPTKKIKTKKTKGKDIEMKNKSDLETNLINN